MCVLFVQRAIHQQGLKDGWKREGVCAVADPGGFHGFHGTPFHKKALLIMYLGSYWAIIAYFLGYVHNCCGFCD